MKHINIFLTLILQIATLSLIALSSGAHATAVCLNKLGGTFNFGVAPYACNVSTFIAPSTITSEYPSVIYDDSKSVSVARENYMSNIYPVLRDVGKYYIQRRNPKVSPAEEEGFVAGLYSLAMQESVFSHYRVGTDRIVRFMRGDSLHGYGFMQVDDRSHASDIAKGAGADLIDNMLYGLNIYYAGWLQSAKAKCISSASDYKDRARAAWAVYNGGSRAICRWTKTNTHDSEYLSQYTKQPWHAVVKDPQAASPVDVICMAEGKRPCAGAPAPATPAAATAKIATPASLGTADLNAQISYRLLRACGSATCATVPGAIRASEPVSLIGTAVGDWIEVASLKDGHSGWLKLSDLANISK